MIIALRIIYFKHLLNPTDVPLPSLERIFMGCSLNSLRLREGHFVIIYVLSQIMLIATEVHFTVFIELLFVCGQAGFFVR